MKKAATIFLLSVYLLSATQLYELLKVNVLIEHFYETRQAEHRGVSFLEFLVMHYITDDGNNKDNDRDSQLPFKSHGSLVANSISTFILNKAEAIVPVHVMAGKADFRNYCDPFVTSNFCSQVWNPPRIS